MTRTRSRRAIAIGALLVLAAILLSVLQPTEELQLSPYASTIEELDTPYAARTFTVTVSGAQLADRIQIDGRQARTPGVWLVVDAEFVRRLTGGSMTAVLDVGGTTYGESARMDTDGLGALPSQPGLAMAGSIAFELPESALTAPGADAAVVRFATTAEPQLDSALDLVVDLTDLDRVADLSILPAGRVSG